jgi:hypothetical protein
MYAMLTLLCGQLFTIATPAPDTKPQSLPSAQSWGERPSQKDTESETRLPGARKLH